MTLLLLVIYVAFIGLGVPDSLIGSAWPSIYTELSLPVGAVSAVTLLISGATVLSSILSGRILNKFGTPAVTVVSTAMTAVSLVGFALSPSIYFMLPAAVVLGLGAGAIDAGLNNYVAIHFSARQMNLLHCFYGIGVTVSPYVMSLAISGTGWRQGYLIAAGIQLIITLMLLLSVPLWKKGVANVSGEESVSLSLPEIARTSGVLPLWIVMITTNAIEYAAGVWGSTYLVETRGLTAAEGAAAISLYYLGLALSRLISGLLATRLGTFRRIWIGVGMLFVSMLVLLLPLGAVGGIVGLSLIGLSNGAIYPNLIHLTPYSFGEERSQSIMGTLIAFAYVGVMLSPPLISLLTSLIGIDSYPIIIIVLYIVMTATLLLYKRAVKKAGRYNDKV